MAGVEVGQRASRVALGRDGAFDRHRVFPLAVPIGDRERGWRGSHLLLVDAGHAVLGQQLEDLLDPLLLGLPLRRRRRSGHPRSVVLRSAV